MSTVHVQTMRSPRAPISAKASMEARAKARSAGTATKTERQNMDGSPKKQSRWKDVDFKEANEKLVAEAKELVKQSKADARKDKSGKPKKTLTLAGAVAQLQKQRADAEKGEPEKGKPNESDDGDAGATAGGDVSDSKAKPPKVKKTDKVDDSGSPKNRRG